MQSFFLLKLSREAHEGRKALTREAQSANELLQHNQWGVGGENGEEKIAYGQSPFRLDCGRNQTREQA